MTEKLKFRSSLNASMLFSMLAALLAGLLVFFAFNFAGKQLISKVYMSSENVAARKSEITSQFSSFVSSRNLTGHDSAAIAGWTKQHGDVTILIYKGNRLRLSAREGKAEAPVMNVQENSPVAGNLIPMRFADGVYQLAISESSQDRQYALNNVISVFVASVAFILCMLLYVRRLTKRIIRLSAEAAAVGAGDLNAPIRSAGSDELSMLAKEMDHMRSSVIEQMGSESRAWQANSELITAISHDIRTPMTSMIGYLGLLNESDFSDKERCRQFAASAYDKAMVLKELTDQLFKYFLVFGKSDLDMEIERFELRLLLPQLMGEAEFDLRDAGFSVSSSVCDADGYIDADSLYLKRVFDNLVSNVKKYADRSEPVLLLSEVNGGILSVCFSNRIAPSLAKVESTKIGIRTCEKIMRHMGGDFTTAAEADRFTSELRIPLK